jgi:putative transposase
MPPKNTIKIYQPNTYYHLYNRGVNKFPIFDDDQDNKTFLFLLKEYLTPALENPFPSRAKNNFYQSITLHAYCLMPNHFHLLIHQKNITDINYFMRSLNTNYVHYYNKRNHRVGPLYQSSYKAVTITTDEQLIYLTKYIHLNPHSLVTNTSESLPEVIHSYPYSSYRNYLGLINQTWVNTQTVLDYFSHTHPHTSYQDFVENQDFSDTINPLLID